MNFSRRTIIITGVGILIVLAIWGVSGFRASYDIINIDSTGTDIVAFGDSLVQGVGATPGNDFVSVLSRRIGEPIINMGHSGDTTAAGVARLNSIFEYKPKVVIVLLGGNDFLRKVPMDTLFYNLKNIVRIIQLHGSSVLLLGIRGGLITDAYADRFEDFAREVKVGFVPNVLYGLLGDRKLMSDEIHPNDVGYSLIADKVEPVLRDMLRQNQETIR